MKRIITMSAILLAVAASVQAQDTTMTKQHMHHKMEKGRQDHMMKDLNLTNAQKEQMKANRQSFKKQMDELKNNDKLTREERNTRRKALMQQQHEQMQSILTAEQKEKMKAANKDRMKDHGAMEKKQREEMKTQLGLTAEQDRKLAEMHKANMEKMKAIRDNKSLTEDAKKEQMKALKQQQEEAMKSILTPEQVSKMKEMHKGQHHQKGPKNKQ